MRVLIALALTMVASGGRQNPGAGQLRVEPNGGTGALRQFTGRVRGGLVNSCRCVPPSECLWAPAGVSQASCRLADLSVGVCCQAPPTAPLPGSLPGLISTQQNPHTPPQSSYSESSITAEEQMAAQERLERRLMRQRVVARGPERRHHHLQPFSPARQKVGRRALLRLLRRLKKRREGGGRRGGGRRGGGRRGGGRRDNGRRLYGRRRGGRRRRSLGQIWVVGRQDGGSNSDNDEEQDSNCLAPTTPDCPSFPSFRTFDGSCNNPTNRRLGMAGEALLRLLPSRYDDGMLAARSLQRDGSLLPSARLISQSITSDSEAADDRFTISVMQWGQLVSHDVVLTPTFSLGNGQRIACCSADGKPLPEDTTHPQCLAIEIPADDPFFGKFGRSCMNFVRSLLAEVPDCGAPPDAQQQNAITHYLDGSLIYGSDADQQRQLRDLSGGRMKTQPGQLLPADERAFCFNASAQCFAAGDIRVNQQVTLTLVHTIWLREHNRIAAALEARHCDWDDERLFQEARRVVIGQLQHITYNEFLPTLLDLDYRSRNELLMESGSSYSSKYRSQIKPLITNAFSTAAYRFGHSLAPGTIGLFSSLGVQTSSVLLRDVFFDPHLLYDADLLTQVARGLAAQRTQALDTNFATDLTEHLFQPNASKPGLDLVAFNIQRGRDHGLATYNDARAATGQSRASTWEDLRHDMPSEAITALRDVYGHVDDVDLFIGGLLERPLPHVLLGRTFGRLVGDQFIRLRHGDNFFYDLGGSKRPWRLSRAQLKQVRRTSWARVLCDNVPDVARIQPLAFRVADHATNAVTDCDSDAIPWVDLNMWW